MGAAETASGSVVEGVDLAEDDAGLDRAVPVVDLEAHGGVEHVVVIDAEAGAAEGDAEGAVASRCGG